MKMTRQDKEYTITDRQICNLIELSSRVIKQINLIKEGKTTTNGKDRMDIAVDCCEKTYKVLISLEQTKEN